MNRRDFIKSSICCGCAGTFGIKFDIPAEAKILTPEIEKAMQKFAYKSVDELPKSIRFNICNFCQLNCPACGTKMVDKEIRKYGGGYGYTHFKDFKKLLDKNPSIKEIEISSNGEILLNPDFDKIIKYAYKKNVALTAYSGVNLNTISEETAENLVKYQFKMITVSIDGATPETYAIYRRGGDFNTVINNIKMINKYKEKYNSVYPVLVYKFIIFGHNEHEINDVKKIAKDLKMPLQYDINYAPWYSPVKDKERVKRLTGLKHIEQCGEKYLQDYKDGILNWYYCTDFFSKPQFNIDGELYGCCINNYQTFGANILKDGLLKCLNNKKVLYAKLLLTDFKYGERYKIPCNTCWVYKDLKKNNYPIQAERHV